MHSLNILPLVLGTAAALPRAQDCVQIQHTFDSSENGPGTESYDRAEAVKVNSYRLQYI